MPSNFRRNSESRYKISYRFPASIQEVLWVFEGGEVRAARDIHDSDTVKLPAQRNQEDETRVRRGTSTLRRNKVEAHRGSAPTKVISERDLQEHMVEMEARNSNGTRRATHT